MIKQLFMLLTALTLTLGVSAQQKGSEPKAKIKLDVSVNPKTLTRAIDFDTFDMRHPVQKKTVKFKNVGNAKLVINDVKVSCSCMKVKYPEKFIAPGGTGKIEVTYTASKAGDFCKDITILSNGDPAMLSVFVVGTVLDAPAKK